MPGDDAPIASKLANALVPGAAPTALASRFSGPGARFVFDWVRKSQGGLWVGGTLTLTSAALTFKANALNRAVHVGDTSRSVSLQRIIEVQDRFGFITRIVDVVLDDGSRFTFRCFGARDFAARIAAAAAAARQASH